MIKLYYCLSVEHDYHLLLLAALVCIVGSLACSFMLLRMRDRVGALRKIWIATIAVTASATIWATHFIAMLSYEPGVGFVFDLFWTSASLCVSVAFNVLAFSLISGSRSTMRLLGGVVLGLGIAATHYSGMLGLLPDGIKEWDITYVLSSVLAGVGFATLFIHAHSRSASARAAMPVGLLLVVAICSLHFLGMTALTIVPYPHQISPDLSISPQLLGALIAAVASVVLQAGVAGAILDLRLSDARRMSEDKLRQSEERFFLAIRGSSDGIWDWDVKTRTVFFSDRFKEMLGYKGNELAPSVDAYQAIIHPDDRDRVNAAMARHFSRRTQFDEEYRLLGKGGHYRWFRVRGQAVWNAGAQATRMAGSMADIDDLVNARLASEEARVQADQANRLKSEFLANMSHEIRTPLNGILGMAQLLEKTNLDGKQSKYTQTIRSSGAALLAIINDVLDISKIESGLVALEEDIFDLREIMQQAEDAVAGIAAQKGLHCEIRIQCGEDLTYVGDAKRIRQVLINFAGNATKFTDEGRVELAAKRLRSGHIRFSVTDTGPGIAADQQDLIFGRFMQADGSATRKHGGTGLGLAISKDLVELMGGEIGVESKLGKGSTFWFTLPLKPANAAADSHDSGTGTFANASGIRADQLVVTILLAEDNLVNREMIASSLELVDNVTLISVADGKAAIDALDAGEFDLVLMDINMPVMTGDRAIIEIRKCGKSYSDIPIVALTANAMSEQSKTYLEIGATECMLKPLNIDNLFALVERYRPSIDSRRVA